MKLKWKRNRETLISNIIHKISKSYETYIRLNGKIELKLNKGVVIKKTQCGKLEINNINEYMEAYRKGLI